MALHQPYCNFARVGFLLFPTLVCSWARRAAGLEFSKRATARASRPPEGSFAKIKKSRQQALRYVPGGKSTRRARGAAANGTDGQTGRRADGLYVLDRHAAVS